LDLMAEHPMVQRPLRRLRLDSTVTVGLALIGSIVGLGSSLATELDRESTDRPRVVAGSYHVYPGEQIQEVLELAASDPENKTVWVHPGTYRPARRGQALVWFNRRHDGITLAAKGRVVLTAANPKLADPAAPSYPAVVNHVVYFGDGVSSATRMIGFEITGANNFVIDSEEIGAVEGEAALPELEKDSFFYSDGGGIKIFGRSYPILEKLVVHNNYTSPCGGGVSVEHRGFNNKAVTFRDSIFRENRTQITGAAIDLLPGSAEIIENCLFVGNVANTGPDYLSMQGDEYQKESGSGALTVFEGSNVWVRNSTFTGNWNGVDDKGAGNIYTDSIFWRNDARGGISPGPRYELDILDGSNVRGCKISGEIGDVRGTVSAVENDLSASDPDFGAGFVPRNPSYDGIGYRPVEERVEISVSSTLAKSTLVE
ncbi:MAG: right-handed parallel beta-helix repeat-containing protein, partial [Acidobacteriota bacterium]